MKLREHYNLDEMLDFFDKMYAMAKEHFEDQKSVLKKQVQSVFGPAHFRSIETLFLNLHASVQSI